MACRFADKRHADKRVVSATVLGQILNYGEPFERVRVVRRKEVHKKTSLTSLTVNNAPNSGSYRH